MKTEKITIAIALFSLGVSIFSVCLDWQQGGQIQEVKGEVSVIKDSPSQRAYRKLNKVRDMQSRVSNYSRCKNYSRNLSEYENNLSLLYYKGNYSRILNTKIPVKDGCFPSPSQYEVSWVILLVPFLMISIITVIYWFYLEEKEYNN